MNIKNYRKGNIEVRLAHTIAFKDKESKAYWDVVFWYPNCYYGHIDEYKPVDGHPGMYTRKNGAYWETHSFIHESCFKNPESCYSIGSFVQCEDDEPDFKSVGSRPWNIPDDEKKNLEDVIKKFYEMYYEDSDQYDD